MKKILTCFGLILVSVPLAEIVTLVFFLLRFVTDSLGLPPNFYIIVPFLIPLLTGYVIYLFAKKINLDKAKQLGIFIFIIWLLWLTVLGKLILS